MMDTIRNFIENSAFLPVLAGVVFYLLGDLLRKKLRVSAINPLLISIVLTIILVLCLRMDYGTYKEGAEFMNYLLTPATVCLAIPLYRRINVLRGNGVAIIAGIAVGTVSSIAIILVMSLAFGLTHGEYVTLLPKSITTAIGLGLSEELGGDTAVTAAAIIVTGVFGNVAGEGILRLFRIKEPVAKGVAMGTASHAIGTTKALEMGETEGAVSSLSIVVSGIVTVAAASVFAGMM